MLASSLVEVRLQNLFFFEFWWNVLFVCMKVTVLLHLPQSIHKLSSSFWYQNYSVVMHINNLIFWDRRKSLTHCLKQWCEELVWGTGMRNGYKELVWGMGIRNGHEEWVSRMGMRNGYQEWARGMDMRNKCVDNDFNYYRGGCEIPTWQVKPLTTSTLPYLVSLKFGGKAQNTLFW